MTLDYIMLWFIISNEPQEDTALLSWSWWILPLLQHFLCCHWGKFVMKEPTVHWKTSVLLLSGHTAAQIAPEQGQKQCSHSSSNTKLRPAEKTKRMPEGECTWNKSWGLPSKKTNPFCNCQKLFGHLEYHAGMLSIKIVFMRRKKMN